MGLKRQVTFLKNSCMIDICQSSKNMAMYAMMLKIKFQNYKLEDQNQASLIEVTAFTSSLLFAIH